MLTFSDRNAARNCAGVTRRNFLRLGTLGLGGLSLADWLRNRSEAAAGSSAAQDKSVILYWLDGGPTQFETYDPKPEAPVEYRGPLGVTATNVPGIYVSELLKEHAKVIDKVALLRSVYHDNGDHFAAAHWMLTGYLGSNAVNQEPKNPSAGAIIAKVLGPVRPTMPAYVAVPSAHTVGLNPGYNSGAYLGPPFNPFETGDDPNRDGFQVRNLNLPGDVPAARLDDRRALLAGLDQLRRELDHSGMMDSLDRFNVEALEMITGAEARQAFDLSAEDPGLRERYGRTTYGQSALLARRLVEAGVRFVTIHNGGWDHHSEIEAGMRSRLPSMDRSIGVLIQDLAERGLLESTIVCVMGEFGRTPRVNGSGGRDHWGNCMSVLLGGGGLRGGQVVGASNSKGEYPVETPLQPADVLATIYRALGIDLSLAFHNHAGRPIPINNHGQPIPALL